VSAFVREQFAELAYVRVTTEPNEMLASVHNRMPVKLSDSSALDWLNGSEIDHALRLLRPFPAEWMDGYDVSKTVNNPVNDTSDCFAPVK
jgi:putative SOS response-associated peptidase YedK